MKIPRILFLPCACFVLTWGAAHLVRTFAAVGDSAPPRRTVAASERGAPTRPGIDRLRQLREAFAKAPPGGWSALWAEFATGAEVPDLEKLFRDDKGTLRQLAEEELAVRTGKAAGSPGAFAALAEHDPEAAWQQVRNTGQNESAAAVLRVLASRDPEDALRRWSDMPVRPAPRALTSDERLGMGRTAVTHTTLGSLFASWARRDPVAAAAAVDSLRARFHQEARNEIAMAWAYHDGPAALRYVSQFTAKTGTQPWRLDSILLSSLIRWPAESAALLAQEPSLQAGTQDWIVPWAVPALWYLADPDGCLRWFHSSGKSHDLYYSKAVMRNPAAAARLLREFPLPEGTDPAPVVSGLALRDRAFGLALADEFQVRPAVEAALRHSGAIADPAAACRKWLDALKTHGADEALKILGWTAETARDISDFAKQCLPEQARELAPLLPDPGPASAAAVSSNTAPPAAPADPWSGSRKSQFVLDPATAAAGLLASGGPLREWDAWNAVSLWAPHDFAAARDWLSRVPEGRARQWGQAALASSLADRDPGEALTLLTSLTDLPEKSAADVWNQSLQRLVLTGGDWRKWLERLPRKSRARIPGDPETPEKALPAEAALLATLRKTGPP